MNVEKTQAKRQPIPATISLQELLVRVRQDPFGMFVGWPLPQVREACLEMLRRSDWLCDSDRADWAEQCIRDLWAEDRDWAQKLMDWYFHSDTDRMHDNVGLELRAMRFALALERDRRPANLSKHICGMLKRWDRDLYDQVPELRECLKKYLLRIHPGDEQLGLEDGYFDTDWYPVERALTVIVLMGDHSFLPIIAMLIAAHKSKRIQPESSWQEKDPFTAAVVKAKLREAHRVLLKLQRSEQAKSSQESKQS